MGRQVIAVMRRRRKGCSVHMLAMAIGILLGMMLPPWWCFWILCVLLVLICFC